MRHRWGSAGWGVLLCAAGLLAGCHRAAPESSTASAGAPAAAPAPADAKILNVYNWYDYINPEVVRDFQTRYGVEVRYDVFDSNNTMAARLLAGHSGYDVAFPSGAYLESLTAAGVFRPLDKTRLPNLVNMDPGIMRALAAHDPGNAHAIVYTWGITGFAYDARKVQARLASAPVSSWSMLFDPKVAAHFADCGIGLYESPNVIVPSVLAWLGQPPNSEDVRLLDKAQAALMAVRPFIRKISSGSLVDDLATGELCIIIASNGDALQVRERRHIAGNPDEVRFTIPREGAVMWLDTAAIVGDAQHVRNAHLFINYLMDPQVAAANSNAIHFPNGNAAAQRLLRPELANASIYPDEKLAARLIAERPKSEAYVRLRTRMWTRFRTGK